MEEKSEEQNKENNFDGKVFYRVVEYLFQDILSIHGEGMDRYDSRIVKKRISNKSKAEDLAQELRKEAACKNLSHHFRYEVELYSTGPKEKAWSKRVK